MSDRQGIIFDTEDDRQKDFDDDSGGFEKIVKKYEDNSGFNKVGEENMSPEKSQLDLEEDNVIFKDFTEPDLLKTGYLIPLTCGHNGQLSINEKTIYEVHLTNAGFIQNDSANNVSGDVHRSSDPDSYKV